MPSPSRRSWFKPTASRMVAIILLALFTYAGYARHVQPYKVERAAAVCLARRHDLEVKTRTEGSWLLRQIWGDAAFQRVVHVSILDGDWSAESLKELKKLSHLQSLLVTGTSFDDADLKQLHRIQSLRALVLDTTLVTADGIDELKEALPDLWCHRSQRKVVRDLRKWMELTTNSSAASDVKRWLPIEDLQQVVTAKVRRQARNSVSKDWLLKLQQLDSLQRLIFFRTNIADNQLAYLARLSNLRFLWLDSKSITDGGLSHLKSLVNLEELELQSTQITSQGLEQLHQMHKLRTLNIGRTSVDDDALAKLTKMKRLESLRLFGTKVTDKGMIHLRSLRSLKNLYLEGTRVTNNAVRLLRKSLPDIKVSR